ncbi:hypothetical protein D3C71_190110 [compost metagenome]
MGVVMRQIVKPSLVAFASGQRLAAVDGDGTPSLGTRLTALADLIPFLASDSSVRGYHACDLLVTSGNPLLATLALRAAVKAGVKPAIVMTYGDDLWPYDLAATDETGRILASALRMDVPQAASGRIIEFIMERLLADISRDIPVINNTVAPGTRNPEGEGAFFMGEEAVRYRPLDLGHMRLSTVFTRFMIGRSRLAPMAKGRTVVFAKRMLLTSRVGDFGMSKVSDGMISWSGGVAGTGSARWDLPTYPDAAKGMLEDLIMLSRGLPAD